MSVLREAKVSESEHEAVGQLVRTISHLNEAEIQMTRFGVVLLPSGFVVLRFLGVSLLSSGTRCGWT